ncbi:MAG: PH domain-containing protein [Ruminococcaceae bacterium]|nr:PH domain-containing protein [Oscillospiraceae bacterium]
MANTVKPNYVMKKSAWSVIRPWHLIFFFLIVPLIIMIVKIINVKDDKILFYNNKVVQQSGVFSKYEKTNILTRVLSVTVKQTFWGRLFDYGTVKVDVVGEWDINMSGVKDPMGAKAFLETFVANGAAVKPIIMN